MKFWEGVFSENGTGSASRVLTALHSVVAAGCLIYVVVHTHQLPSVDELAGLGGFATVHYLVNQTRTAVASFAGKSQA